MSSLFASTAVAQSSTHPNVWRTILHSLPSDPASLFTLVLVVAVVVLVVTAGRRSNRKDDTGLPS